MISLLGVRNARSTSPPLYRVTTRTSRLRISLVYSVRCRWNPPSSSPTRARPPRNREPVSGSDRQTTRIRWRAHVRPLTCALTVRVRDLFGHTLVAHKPTPRPLDSRITPRTPSNRHPCGVRDRLPEPPWWGHVPILAHGRFLERPVSGVPSVSGLTIPCQRYCSVDADVSNLPGDGNPSTVERYPPRHHCVRRTATPRLLERTLSDHGRRSRFTLALLRSRSLLLWPFVTLTRETHTHPGPPLFVGNAL